MVKKCVTPKGGNVTYFGDSFHWVELAWPLPPMEYAKCAHVMVFGMRLCRLSQVASLRCSKLEFIPKAGKSDYTCDISFIANIR